MRMKPKNLAPRLVAVFALILLLACALIGSGVLSKYIAQSSVANEVSYTNQLAESFKLLDQPITRLEDGSYERDETADAQPTAGYTYQLIPGITLPAAPYVEITGKTAIPAYLYLEVDNSGPVSLSFSSDWTELTGVTGKNDGTVYAYDNGAALTGDDPTAVLTVQTFTVDALGSTPLTDEGEIKVYAYMIQKVGETTAEQAFSAAPAP